MFPGLRPMVGVLVYLFILPVSLSGVVVLVGLPCGWAFCTDSLGVAECVEGLQHAVVVPVL